jgi:hypothetical protein
MFNFLLRGLLAIDNKTTGLNALLASFAGAGRARGPEEDPAIHVSS